MLSFFLLCSLAIATGTFVKASSTHLARAPADYSSSISQVAKECQTLCQPFPTIINTCASNNPQSDADIAKCTCTDQTYTELKACTDCVAAAAGVLSGAHRDTVQQVQAGFKSFGDACTQQGFPVAIIVPQPSPVPSSSNTSPSPSPSSTPQGDSNGGLIIANAGNGPDSGFKNTAGRSVAVYHPLATFVGVLAAAIVIL